MNVRKSNGITLIALVITIIVLLILAGVSISAITGENGIVEKAKMAKEATRAGEIQEAINLALAENKIQEETDGDYKTKIEIIDELVSSKKITAEEAETLKSSDVITIGNVEVDFTELAEYTIKFTIYDRMIGSDIEYEAEKGMTWGDWIESDYNVDGYTQPNEREFSVVDSTKEYWVTGDWDGNNHQGLDDYIMANHAYIQWQYGESPRDNSIDLQ